MSDNNEKVMLFPESEEFTAFAEEIARDVIKGLSEDDKSYMRNHPDPFEYHFSLGLAIRNTYIYGNERYSFLMPDDVSTDIIKVVIAKLMEEK